MSQERLSDEEIARHEEWSKFSSEELEIYFQKMLNTFIFELDFYEYAYKICVAYKTYVDNMNPKDKKAMKIVHNANKMENSVNNFRKGVLIANPIGLVAFGAIKLMQSGKKSRKQIVQEIVDNKFFSDFFELLNNSRID